jgi:hypothetical protein
MESAFKDALWQQFGASIDMLENAILLCPNALWDNEQKFWYNAYHCLFWLDYYLTLTPEQFSPPSGYSFSEFEPSGTLPERVYSKAELLSYLQHNRQKCQDVVLNMTHETANSRWVNDYKNYSVLEILLYNMRHVQHHAAQLNLILRQTINDAPSWVAQAKK